MTGSGTYALLAVPFLGVAVLVAVLAGIVSARRRRAARPEAAARGRRTTVLTGVVAGVALLVMTCVFNNVIVGLGIVAYDPALVLGARIGLFPVEDLAYSIGAVLLLPSSWVLLDGLGTDRSRRPDAVSGPVRSERPTQPSRAAEETP
ncbi:lycopene cyclase domain-containing protein [Curtobacterium sp. MCPF17_011]|uniref:lycopene cyclase domain-containing protein n=1 Tax=unclassified Curtobacterium TaxID=257496 RepID=UPI000D9613C1|nr:MULTISPECIES: lycopene cyclase domain-containing protein [unclassified Curtobacterium]PYY33977.1 lycopene cyclase domain-containing protein [Curtobacterium sp. MCBD17_030]PZF10297.1 lycopene cyclase domain-containing protein [Curtobacterium sp. MCPF17_011]